MDLGHFLTCSIFIHLEASLMVSGFLVRLASN
jgi:hypothetical protein